MTEQQIEQLQSFLQSEAWLIIEDMLKEEIEDYIEGSYSDIAVHLLAKHKAKEHINFVINKIKNIKVDTKQDKKSYK